MQLFETCFYYLCLLLVLLYSVKIVRWAFGWMLYPESYIDEKNPDTKRVTIIVSVRNEENIILSLLHSLSAQVYAHDKIEVIISDDFSEDNTRQTIQTFIEKNRGMTPGFKLVKASAGDTPGKKAALERAISSATGDIILLTDADCTMGKYWVKSFAGYFNKPGVAMVTGFVRLDPGKRLFSMIQALEFLSLSGTGAVSVIFKRPLMCNGANLAFTREAFYEMGGYSYGGSLPTGDDTFLMLRLSGTNREKVVFNKNPSGIVTSAPADSLKQLFIQRIRWASKVTYYKENYIKLTGLFFACVNLLLLVSLLMCALYTWEWKLVATLWVIKALSDLIILSAVSTFAKQQFLLLLFLPATLLYPLYTLAGMVMIPFQKGYAWKGRQYNIRSKNNE